MNDIPSATLMPAATEGAVTTRVDAEIKALRAAGLVDSLGHFYGTFNARAYLLQLLLTATPAVALRDSAVEALAMEIHRTHMPHWGGSVDVLKQLLRRHLSATPSAQGGEAEDRIAFLAESVAVLSKQLEAVTKERDAVRQAWNEREPQLLKAERDLEECQARVANQNEPTDGPLLALRNLLDNSAVITPRKYDKCFVHLEIPVKHYEAAYDALPIEEDET